jgi:hypothetical protein
MIATWTIHLIILTIPDEKYKVPDHSEWKMYQTYVGLYGNVALLTIRFPDEA